MVRYRTSLLLAAAAAAAPELVQSAALLPRQSGGNTAFVDLSSLTRRTTSSHVASGVLYGIPDDPNQIPDHFYSDMGFNFARIGGAQMTQGGWIDGIDAYYARFNNTRDNYRQARKFNNAGVIILPHDIWGTDHANSTTNWPGDNNEWSDYEAYVKQLMSDLKANNMLKGLIWDIWNEPDGYGFWARSQSQYLELWSRTYNIVRSDPAFANVPISGPSSAGQPSPTNSWWTNWIEYVQNTKTIPDSYTWHDEPGDFAIDMANFEYLRNSYGLPEKDININEYGTFDQQQPAGAAWWISRLERYDAHGLRGNWLSACQLRDFLASLLVKTDMNSCSSSAGYTGNGEYQVYKYYAQNMTGVRATTVGTKDYVMDVYATIGSDKVRILTGVNGQQGTWWITISELTALGLPANGTLNIQTWGFIDQGHNTAVGGPTDRGVYGHVYSDNSVTFPVYQTSQDANTAWAFEFAVPSKSAPVNRNADCSPQSPGFGPISTPDTAVAYAANPVFNQIATSVDTPSTYTLAFSGLSAAISQDGFLGVKNLPTYDPAACAAQCTAKKGCVACEFSPFTLSLEVK